MEEKGRFVLNLVNVSHLTPYYSFRNIRRVYNRFSVRNNRYTLEAHPPGAYLSGYTIRYRAQKSTI